MNELNQIQIVQRLTQELQTLHSEIQRSTYNGREYEIINNKLTEQQDKILDICQNCIIQPNLNIELNNYYHEIEKIQILLPDYDDMCEKITNIAHLTICTIKLEMREARIINKISLAFAITPEVVRNQLFDSSENFFVAASNYCFDLANKRLSKPTPLDFEEVKAIHNALSDPQILKHGNKDDSVTNFIQPHPIDVFVSLYKFLESVEVFDSCEDIHNQVQIYLEKKPVSTDLRVQFYLNQPEGDQKATLRGIRAMIDNEGEDTSAATSFIDELEAYTHRLNLFKEGLKNFPIIDIKDIINESININQTYFLHVDGKINWIFKPASMNEKGGEIVQAECTASQLNYHHQFPIPLTISIKIKDWIGSAQVYVENTKKLTEIETEGIPIDRDELQKLAIFDLLFANSDRNDENFIFQYSNDLARIVGIDHDRCLMFKQIEELKMDYLQHKEMRQPINEELRHLFSSDAIQAYKVIMMNNEVPHQMLAWVDTVEEALNKAIENKIPLKVVVLRLQKEYKTMFLEY